MTKTVSANEAKNRFGSLLGYVSEEGGRGRCGEPWQAQGRDHVDFRL